MAVCTPSRPVGTGRHRLRTGRDRPLDLVATIGRALSTVALLAVGIAVGSLSASDEPGMSEHGPADRPVVTATWGR